MMGPDLRSVAASATRVISGLAGALLFAGAWEAFSRTIDNPGLVPPLARVAEAGLAWASSGLLLTDLLESLPRALMALVIATPIGIAIGLVFVLSPPLRRLFDGTLQFMRSLPPVALLPLFIIWFGIDWGAKLSAAVFVCIFPVAVTTAQGATVVNAQFRELAKDLRLGRFEYATRILAPGVAPAVVPGVRLSAGTAFIMLYVSELAGASSGLGYRISIAQLAYQADLMIAALFVLGAIALATDLALQVTAKRLIHYAGRS